MGNKSSTYAQVPASVAAEQALFMDYCKVNTDQKWELTQSGYIKNVIGGRKCIDIKGSVPGSTLELQNCEEWSDPANYLDWKFVKLRNGQVRNELHKACIDVD